jgi:hypothetical protein
MAPTVWCRRAANKIIQAGETAFTLIRRPRAGKGLPGLAALSVMNHSASPNQLREATRGRSVGFDEMAAAILLPASFVALHAEGLLLAEANGGKAIRGDAEGNEILFHGIGAAITEAQVVFRRAALIAVAFNGHFEARIIFQKICGLGECGTSVGTNVRFVVVEIGIWEPNGSRTKYSVWESLLCQVQSI